MEFPNRGSIEQNVRLHTRCVCVFVCSRITNVALAYRYNANLWCCQRKEMVFISISFIREYEEIMNCNFFLTLSKFAVNRTSSNERNELIFIRTHFLLSNHFISDYTVCCCFILFYIFLAVFCFVCILLMRARALVH